MAPHPHDNDAEPNENVAHLVAGPEARAAVHSSAELESAWQKWSTDIQQVDQRLMSQLRAAFNAGYEAGWRSERPS
jgi:hypothetical protein